MKKIVLSATMTCLLALTNTLSAQTETLNGYTIGYNGKTKAGCFFVDREMVEAGVATDIRSKAGSECTSDKYGNGVSMYFGEVPADAPYVRPGENVLMTITGYWVIKNGKHQFNATSIEPFF